MLAPNPGFVAGGTIAPAVFVTPQHGVDNTVVQSVAGDAPIGISANAVKYAPIPQVTSNPCAELGDLITVYGDGQECGLTLGAGGCSAGDYLKPDNNGNGIVATHTSSDVYGAQATQSGNAGDIVRVIVIRWRG